MITVKVNDTVKEIPFDPAEITLGQFIAYYDKYGRDLDKQLDELIAKDYEKILKEKGFEVVTDEDITLFRNMDIDAHIDNEALAWYSFWSGYDLFQVREQPFIIPLLNQFRVLRNLIDQSVRVSPTDKINKQFINEHFWNNEVWVIQNFTVNPASDMTFNEIITSKEVIRQIHAIGKAKWDAMIYLCAIYFRRKDEPFDDELISAGGERMTLMESLPMTYALDVAFFEHLCLHLEKHYSIFKRTGGSQSKPELIAHYEHWGWINFLSSIAETKVFDVPGSGKDSIECAKKAKAHKVLIFASEKKDFNIALNEAYK